MHQERTRKGPVDIVFTDVSFSYGTIRVLESVNFHIHQGEFVALVGANGSGKTTALKLLLGLEKPRTGTITLFENKIRKSYDGIGYVPQGASYDSVFPISVYDVVKMGRLTAHSRKFTIDDDKAVHDAMLTAEVSELSNRPYAALSGGQRRRVLVARALASKPKLLILDEPTANMDSDSESRLFKTLGLLKGKTTIVIVTHDPTFVSSLTDVVLCISDSKKNGEARTVVRHPTLPSKDVPNLFGGNPVKVIHEEELSDNYCCEEGKKQ